MGLRLVWVKARVRVKSRACVRPPQVRLGLKLGLQVDFGQGEFDEHKC